MVCECGHLGTPSAGADSGWCPPYLGIPTAMPTAVQLYAYVSCMLHLRYRRRRSPRDHRIAPGRSAQGFRAGQGRGFDRGCISLLGTVSLGTGRRSLLSTLGDVALSTADFHRPSQARPCCTRYRSLDITRSRFFAFAGYFVWRAARPTTIRHQHVVHERAPPPYVRFVARQNAKDSGTTRWQRHAIQADGRPLCALLLSHRRMTRFDECR